MGFVNVVNLVLKEMLGHADIKTTDTYLNVARIGLHDSMRRFERAGGKGTAANEAATSDPETAGQPNASVN